MIEQETGRMKDGFTILEGIIAMALLGVILTAIAPVFYIGRLTTARSALRQQAVQVASRELETSLASGFDRIQSRSGSVQLGDHPATIRIIVEPVDIAGLPPDTLKEVTAEVEWTFADRSESVTLTTLLSHIGHGS